MHSYFFTNYSAAHWATLYASLCLSCFMCRHVDSKAFNVDYVIATSCCSHLIVSQLSVHTAQPCITGNEQHKNICCCCTPVKCCVFFECQMCWGSMDYDAPPMQAFRINVPDYSSPYSTQHPSEAIEMWTTAVYISFSYAIHGFPYSECFKQLTVNCAKCRYQK